MNNIKVLVVDDDADIRYAIANVLKRCGCVVFESGSVGDAIAELQSHDYDVVFSDMRFHGDLGGEELLVHTIENHPDVKVVMVSCSMNDSQKQELLTKGAAWCLEKPFYCDTCITVLDRLGHEARKAA